jgi:hypothetical protein
LQRGAHLNEAHAHVVHRFRAQSAYRHTMSHRQRARFAASEACIEAAAAKLAYALQYPAGKSLHT